MAAPISPSVSEERQQLHREVKKLQRSLKQRGFDCGPVDGESGVWTKRSAFYADQVSTNPLVELKTKSDCFLNEALRTVGPLSNPLVDRLGGTLCYNVRLLRYWMEQTHGRGQNRIPQYQRTSSELLSKPTWTAGLGGIPPKTGDLFGVWHESAIAVGHCGVILDWCPGEKYFLSIEGSHPDNYDPSENGWPRCMLRRRLRSDVYCALHTDHDHAVP